MTRTFEQGEFRWTRGADDVIWHLTHDGQTTVCQAGAPPSPVEVALGHALGNAASAFDEVRRCSECQAQARSLFGLGRA